jgi:DNA-binding PadR family transcriptional regulator
VPSVKLPDPETLLPLPTATFHILIALAAGDRHGYAIIQDIAARTDNQLRLGAATLYRSLERMLKQGLIIETADSDRPTPELDDQRRRYYRITRYGESVARAEVRRLTDLVRLARGSGFAAGKT